MQKGPFLPLARLGTVSSEMYSFEAGVGVNMTCLISTWIDTVALKASLEFGQVVRRKLYLDIAGNALSEDDGAKTDVNCLGGMTALIRNKVQEFIYRDASFKTV